MFFVLTDGYKVVMNILSGVAGIRCCDSLVVDSLLFDLCSILWKTGSLSTCSV